MKRNMNKYKMYDQQHPQHDTQERHDPKDYEKEQCNCGHTHRHGQECKPDQGSLLAEDLEDMLGAENKCQTDSGIEDLAGHLVCPKCAEQEEEHLRLLAEMENFKKRLTREKEEQMRFAAENVLADLLPTLDNFELALNYGRNNEACKEMVEGLEMTRKLFLDALAAHGLEQVGQVGEPFNPEFHEAMTREARSDMPPDHVAQLFQPGYLLKGRLLRPAKVVVSMA